MKSGAYEKIFSKLVSEGPGPGTQLRRGMAGEMVRAESNPGSVPALLYHRCGTVRRTFVSRATTTWSEISQSDDGACPCKKGYFCHSKDSLWATKVLQLLSL